MVVAYCPSPAFSLLSVPLADSLNGMRRWFLTVVGVLLLAVTGGFLYWLITSANHAADQMFVRPAKAKATILEHIESKGLGHYASVEFDEWYLRATFKYDHEPPYFVAVESRGTDGDFQVKYSHRQSPVTESTYEAEE